MALCYMPYRILEKRSLENPEAFFVSWGHGRQGAQPA